MINVKEYLRPVKHEIERLFSMRPMQKVFKQLISKGYKLNNMNELELFGGKGDIHLVEVYRAVKTVKVWEYNSDFVKQLQRKFSKATVQCVDTYLAVKEENDKYDIIISDNPMQTEGGHIEHFDLFPHILDLLNKKGILIVSIIPNPNENHLSFYPNLFTKEHLLARKEFYNCKNPENITNEEFEMAFKSELDKSNKILAWSFIQKRNDLLSYFVCGIQ